jgi:hypothetical protein
MTHFLSIVSLKHALFCDRSTAEFIVTYAFPYVSPDDFSGITRWAGDTVYLRMEGVTQSLDLN